MASWYELCKSSGNGSGGSVVVVEAVAVAVVAGCSCCFCCRSYHRGCCCQPSCFTCNEHQFDGMRDDKDDVSEMHSCSHKIATDTTQTRC